jgi:hypothetical protein
VIGGCSRANGCAAVMSFDATAVRDAGMTLLS